MNRKQLLFSLAALILSFSSNHLFAQCAETDGSILVTTTADEGVGSLREAINCANSTPGANLIRFAIPDDGLQRIFVGSTSGDPLPSINDEGTIIDGTTQAGFGQIDNFPRIILDGSQTNWQGPYNGLFILADDCEVYGLEMTNFPDDGIDVYNADNVVIGGPGRGNMIYNNGIQQDVFPGFSGSWEGCSVVLRTGSNNCLVQGNIIGTDRNLRGGIGSEFCGIINRSGADNNLIGGNLPGQANLIAFNPVGIRVDNSTGVRIQQNIMYCNDTVAIQLIRNANFNKPAPVITAATVDRISGTAQPNDLIEVFIADRSCISTPCQGRELLGVTTTDAQGNWTLATFEEDVTNLEGETITATATDNANNTSSFASCQGIIDQDMCADARGFIYVTNTADEGPGSLRSAIDCANNSPGPNVIRFNIPGQGPHRIYIGQTSDERLQPLTDTRTTIDGTSQAGYGINNNFQPQIILDGSRKVWRAANNAIWVRADYTEIYGLEITNFPDDGIDLTDADFCRIGDANRGNVIYNVGSEQDFFPETSGGPWEGCGIVMKLGSRGNIIRGNYLGTNYQQTNTSGIEYCGIIIRDGGDNNIIGGTGVGEGNIIANNAGGISVRQNSFNTRIQGNSFYCNDTLAVELRGNANNGHPAPVISSATVETLTGTAAANDIVEVYLSDNSNCQNAICQGRILLGRVTANGNGSWTLEAPFNQVGALQEDDIVTALGTNVLGNTSPFAACKTVGEEANCVLSATTRNVQNATCNQNNGAFQVVPLNGRFPYTFDIGEGPTDNNNFSNIGAGTYDVTVTDGSSCIAITSLTISITNSPIANIANVQNASCGQSNGEFSVSVQGGTTPIRYDIGFGSQNNGDFTNLVAGDYMITITDANDCIDIKPVSIGDVEPPTATITDQVDAICEEGEASFAVAASNGTPPYTYDIGNGATDNNVFGPLTAGTYAVTVTDANGCTATVSTTVQASTSPDADIASVSNASCGSNDGQFSLFVRSGTGTAPFTFATGELTSSTGNFTNLAPDTYTITITDANGCQDIEGITIGSASPPQGTVNNIQNATCGNNNAGFTVNVQGGTAPFTYDIGNGGVSNNVFENLSSGTYAVTITDANGCEDVQGVSVPNDPAPLLTIVSITPASCGGSDGAFRINANQGTPPYTFDIGNGTQDNGSFANLSEGIYPTTVIDGNGCVSNINVQIAGGTPPTSSIASTSDAACGQNNGSFTLSINGGASPYALNYGSGNISGTSATNLAAGDYDVTITDANNCTTTQTVSIAGEAGPTVTINAVNSATCSGNDGSFSVSVNNGTPPFSYAIGADNVVDNGVFNNLSQGDYTVTVTDANNCEATQLISVDGETRLNTGTSGVKPPSCGASDGAFKIEVSNGQAPFTYNLGEGQVSDPSFENLAPGLYQVTITDAGNCTAVEEISFENSGVEPVARFTYMRDDLTITITNNSDAATFNSWTFGDGTEDESYSPTHTYAGDGQYTICLNVANQCGSDFVCSELNIGGVTDPKANITGSISQENGQSVDEVQVNVTNLQPMTTGDDGNFFFNELRANNDTYTIMPYKNINHINGVTTFDLFLINKHILGIERLESPYKQIAADVNKSGTITAFDLVILRKLILNIDQDFGERNTSWRFVPKAYVWQDAANALNEDFPEEITVNLNQDMALQDFIGIKIGDVNDSALPENIVPIDERNAATELLIEDQFFTKNQLVEVPIRLKDFNDIVALQMGLTIDDIMLQSVDFQSNNYMEISEGNSFKGALAFAKNGTITASLINNKAVQNNEIITLKFRTLQAGQLSKSLFLTNENIRSEAYQSQGAASQLALQFTTTNSLVGKAELLPNFPNPFVAKTTLQFHLPSSGEVQITIFDGKGKQLQFFDYLGTKGINQVEINDSSLQLNSGVFYYQIATESGVLNGRMLKI